MQMILKANCWLAMPIIIITKLWPRFSLKLLKVNTNIMLLVLSGEIFQSYTTSSMFWGEISCKIFSTKLEQHRDHQVIYED